MLDPEKRKNELPGLNYIFFETGLVVFGVSDNSDPDRSMIDYQGLVMLKEPKSEVY